MCKDFIIMAGGALSGYAGASKISSSAKATSKAGKMAAKGLDYGIQANVADFAYTSKESYAKRTPQQHAGIFAVGAAGGIIQGIVGDKKIPFRNVEKWEARAANYFVQSSLFYGTEFMLSAVVKGNDKGMYTGGWQTKAGVGGYKALMYSLMLY